MAHGNRLELYLRNMDLLKINPSIGIIASHLDLNSNSTVHGFLKLLNNWSIRTCYLSDRPKHLQPLFEYFKENSAESIYKNIKFFVKFSPQKEQFIYSQRDHIEKTLKAKLFSGSGYEKYKKVWGKDVFYFFNDHPEIFPVAQGKKTIQQLISNPEDVVSIYLVSEQIDGETNRFKYSDITTNLDHQSGILKISGPRPKEMTVVILRHCYIQNREKALYEINYLDADNITNLQADHFQEVIDHTPVQLPTFYELDLLLAGVASSEPFFDVVNSSQSTTAGSEDGDLYTLVAQYYLSSDDQRNTMLNKIKRLYLSHLKNKILNKLHVKRSTNFLLPVEHPLFSDLVDAYPLIPVIDGNRLLPGTPYCLKTIIHLKKLINTCMQAGISEIPVAMDTLLNVERNFTEKKFTTDYLFLRGANHVYFSYSALNKGSDPLSLSEVKKWDPNFPAYSDWFAYVHQLGHFFKLGIRRPEILVLYPSLDEDLDLFNQTLSELEKSGFDYTLIDLESFCNDRFCSIQEKELILHNHNYRILLIPAIQRLSIECLQKLNRYYTNGGLIIAVGRLISISKDDKKSALMKRIKKEIFLDVTDTDSTIFKQHDSGGRAYFQPDVTRLNHILQDLKHHLRLEIESKIPGIVYQLREINDNYFIFVLNTNQQQSISFKIMSKYLGRPFCWDFRIAESNPCGNWYLKDNKIHLFLTLQPCESRLFILDKKQSLKVDQLLESDLAGTKIIQQDSRALRFEGWQRKEGQFSLKIRRGESRKSLSYAVDKKLPVLVIDSKGWYVDSEHFKGKVSLGDQSYPFPFHSTTLTYSKLIVLKKEYLEKSKLFLDLGKVIDWCAIQINDQFVERRLFGPWNFDVSEFLKEGENKISIQVTNKLSNRLTAYNEQTESQFTVQDYGLLGPVRIIPYRYFNFKP
jgi:hypothetical protein